MAYSKQNFQNGQILNAANLEAMENGIISGQGARNLLVNSDFRNPIDIDNKIGAINVDPCFTRWNIERANSNTTTQIIKIDNGIRVYKNGGIARFCQSCNYNLLGKTVSYAIGTTEGIFVGSCSVSTNSVFTRIGTHTGYLSVYYSSASGKTVFSLYFNDNSEDAIDLYWAALYEGAYTKETLPSYVPKGKHVEMLNCNVPLAPHNLLDNSDFTNPVNQRGKTSWSSSGYTIDRWRTNSSISVSLSSTGITMDATSTSGELQQNIRGLPNGTYTFAALVNGVVRSRVFTNDNGTITHVDTSNGSFGGSGYLSFGKGSGDYYFQIKNTAGYTNTVVWAALYEGSYTAGTLPAYQPKGYAAELSECQRYYYQSWDGASFPNKGWITKEAISASSLALTEYPTEMRIVPTITFYTAANETGVVKEWTTSSSVSATQNYTSTKAFGVSGGGNFTTGKTYYFHYTASADL